MHIFVKFTVRVETKSQFIFLPDLLNFTRTNSLYNC